MGQLIIFMA